MDRIEKISNWLKNQGADCAFIHSKENVFYLTGFLTNPHERVMGVFLFPDEEPFFLCPNMEVEQARTAGWNHQIIGYGDHENPWHLVKIELEKRKLAIEAAAIETEEISYARAEALKSVFSGAEFVSVDGKLKEERLVKDKREIEILREAAKLADYGVEVGVSAVKAGVSEMDVLAKIEFELKKKGIQDMSFSTMVLFGEKSGKPHGNPGLEQLKEGYFVLFDLGVVFEGYCSDITRTFTYKHMDEKQNDIYNTVLHAETSALKMCKPGVRIGDLDKKAREIIEESGYGDYFPHRLGHGLGISVHEYPSITHTNDLLLEKGMAFTIEPGIYLPEVGGVRIEDDILITNDGFETMTSYPKDQMIIK
ncbi:Xaa-Pro peptidase family protein [Bacillus gobiensis]|uniref:M24 family metallopeptidase n=1 Tax=Bacillus gobiensis TaxID=1441095 RepID=UPI003D1DB2B1